MMERKARKGSINNGLVNRKEPQRHSKKLGNGEGGSRKSKQVDGIEICGNAWNGDVT